MFLDHRDEFTGWKLSQDVVWEKPVGTSLVADRFKRVHEHALHWYYGQWSSVHHVAPREPYFGPPAGFAKARTTRGSHLGDDGSARPPYEDDGTRLVRSVVRIQNHFIGALHPTEKPLGILDPLISYACPPGGTVLDPFAGSGSTLVAARDSGRNAIGIEADEHYAEIAARRFDQGSLFGDEDVS